MRLGYRPELDGIRGVAILLVVAGHYRLAPALSGIAGVIGSVSYGIYLYHNIFPYLGWWQSPSLVVLALALTLLAAYASDRWLERRFRRSRQTASVLAAEPATA